MTFAEALARIEYLTSFLKDGDDGSLPYNEKWVEHKELLLRHVDSIVQLAKVADRNRCRCGSGCDPDDGCSGEEDV